MHQTTKTYPQMKVRNTCLLFFLTLSLWFFGVCPGIAESPKGQVLPKVPPKTAKPEWSRFKILVWQYETSVLKDIDLYRHLGLGGFHIDRGASREDLVAFSLKEHFPYYVDHAADKGFLYLKDGNAQAVTGKRSLATRPNSLTDPEVISKIKQHLGQNIGTTKKGLVLAYAFDDEISLGSFVTPCDVDVHPLSMKWFREWLKGRYGEIESLNREWDAQFNSFDAVMPRSFEEVRKHARKPPLSKWNLARWMDFRQFMDFQFASVLSELTLYANSLDPKTPAGFVGGQGPGPWGGYDYAKLSRAVQWMEAYDIHGTNEILRSFWNQDRRPRVQTFFSTKNTKLDSWFLWYYMLHGNQAVIAWPERWFRTGGYETAPHILALKNTFEEIQGKVSEPLVSPNTVFDPDPIGIYYSHPSIQAGWAMDAITHGRSWVNRKGTIDDVNQTAGVLRKVWCKLLEDLGLQYDFISYLDVEEGRIDLKNRFKVIILPRTICLSDREAQALRDFVMGGGTLVADYLCGVLDEHGRGRTKGALDDLFGVLRDAPAGYMNGRGLTEIDGEENEKPFLKRFTYYDGAYRFQDIVVFERGTKHRAETECIEIKDNLGLFHRASVLIENRAGKGRTTYLNLSPVEYWDPSKRFSGYGETLRKIVSAIMSSAGIQARVTVYERGSAVNMIEPLYWRNGNQHYVGLIKNPTERKELDKVGQPPEVQGIGGEAVEIQLQFKDPVRGLINLRTNKLHGPGQVFRDNFKPWEGNLYEVIY